MGDDMDRAPGKLRIDPLRQLGGTRCAAGKRRDRRAQGSVPGLYVRLDAAEIQLVPEHALGKQEAAREDEIHGWAPPCGTDIDERRPGLAPRSDDPYRTG